MARTILVVDDNPKITEVLSAYLKAEGFDVEVASDGPAAVAAVERRVPDLALLDVMLPGLDGVELTRRFQRDHDLPVILVTARTEEVDRLIGLEVGADDYILKPFSPREVVARVKAVLRRLERAEARAADGPLRLGELVIDPAGRTLALGGRRVELTRTEFDMLETMATHPGRVFTRMQLMETAQGDAYEGYERTVDAHVKNIRRKLGDDPRAPRYVLTVFGVGYKMEREP
jgi:two-component system, OmpR family, alkaline phosphatase synthesis response regulator PhoP